MKRNNNIVYQRTQARRLPLLLKRRSLAPCPASPARPCSQGLCFPARSTRRPRSAPTPGRARGQPCPGPTHKVRPRYTRKTPARAGRTAGAGLTARHRQRAGRFPWPPAPDPRRVIHAARDGLAAAPPEHAAPSWDGGGVELSPLLLAMGPFLRFLGTFRFFYAHLWGRPGIIFSK